MPLQSNHFACCKISSVSAPGMHRPLCSSNVHLLNQRNFINSIHFRAPYFLSSSALPPRLGPSRRPCASQRHAIDRILVETGSKKKIASHMHNLWYGVWCQNCFYLLRTISSDASDPFTDSPLAFHFRIVFLCWIILHSRTRLHVVRSAPRPAAPVPFIAMPCLACSGARALLDDVFLSASVAAPNAGTDTIKYAIRASIFRKP